MSLNPALPDIVTEYKSEPHLKNSTPIRPRKLSSFRSIAAVVSTSKHSDRLSMLDTRHNHTLEASCQPLDARILFYFLLLGWQCALLHPTFSNSKSSRLIRRALMPLNFYASIRFPFWYCFTPLERMVPSNLRISAISFYLSMKSLEWGFAKGPYYSRKLDEVDGVKRWANREISQDEKRLQESAKTNMLQLFSWTLFQLSSMRGLPFSWGPSISDANRYKTPDLLLRCCKVKFAAFCALYIILSARDSPLSTPRSALLELGVPDFPGLTAVAEALLTSSFGILLACNIDIRFTTMTLYATAIHKVLIFCGCPESIYQLFNPDHYPPIFNSPHRCSSLAEFWAKGWHSTLKRIFVVIGAKPAIWITKRLGGGSTLQRIAFLIGAFTISGIFHEYLLLAACQVPHPNPHLFPNSFPGAALFFLLQPLGIVIEPFIIPFIPHKLGGGKLWVWVFTITTAYTFRVCYIGQQRLDAAFPPFSKIPWKFFLLP